MDIQILTSDGYRFFITSEGQVVDNQALENVDLSWDNLESFFQDTDMAHTIIVKPKYAEPSEQFICSIQPTKSEWQLAIVLHAPGCAWGRDGMTLHTGIYKTQTDAFNEIIKWRELSC